MEQPPGSSRDGARMLHRRNADLAGCGEARDEADRVGLSQLVLALARLQRLLQGRRVPLTIDQVAGDG